MPWPVTPVSQATTGRRFHFFESFQQVSGLNLCDGEDLIQKPLLRQPPSQTICKPPQKNMLLVVYGDNDIVHRCTFFTLCFGILKPRKSASSAHLILRVRAFRLLISFSSCWFPREEGHQPQLLDTQATKFFKVAIFSSHSATRMMELLRQFWCLRRKSFHTTRVMAHWSRSCQLESPLVKNNQFFLNQTDQFFFKSATFLNADDS